MLISQALVKGTARNVEDRINFGSSYRRGASRACKRPERIGESTEQLVRRESPRTIHVWQLSSCLV
jgi:hypothetical protein